MADILTEITDVSSLDHEVGGLFSIFNELAIPHTTYAHPPIFTVEEGVALNLPGLIPGQHGKSLFLTNNNDELWLVVACEETRVNLKALSENLKTKRFSFAKPETMVAVLGVTPGSATPFALMNDKGRAVKVVVEDRFRDASHCVFHPLRNTHSTSIRSTDLFRLIRHWGYEPHILPLA